MSTYKVSSLADCLDVVEDIQCRFQLVNHPDCADGKLFPLWFRGQMMKNPLLPTESRGRAIDPGCVSSQHNYSGRHLMEDYREQHFQAKGNQLLGTVLSSRLAWQEVMQHYFLHTRLMDWTENLFTAILFALEPYIDLQEYSSLTGLRGKIDPVVWVLDPGRLNEAVYERFCSNTYGLTLIRKALPVSGRDREQDVYTLIKEKNVYWDGDEVLPEIRRVPCLASIAEQYQHLTFEQALEFNPLFYMFFRYYCEGVLAKVGELLPLAIVHPYHSPRISAQRGVFTIFPFYELDNVQKTKVGQYSDPRSLELQTLAEHCVHQIHLCQPHKIAREIMIAGERRSSLYPELPYYTPTIEATKYFF